MTTPAPFRTVIPCAASDAITLLYTHGIITGRERGAARRRLATVKDCLTVPTCKQSLQVVAESCPECGALPCDWVKNPHPPSGSEMPTWPELADYWRKRALAAEKALTK